MFGCHKCSYKVDPNIPYENTPCASCKTKNDPVPVSYYDEDPATFSSAYVLHPSDSGTTEEELQNFEMVTLLQAFSKSLRKLVRMKEKFPVTFEIVDAKIAEPNLSYSELAERFSCRKQNVQYHLKKAVRMFPELSFALIVDS